AGSERTIDTRLRKDCTEISHRTGPTRGHQWHLANTAHRGELREIIAVAHAVVRHAVQHDLPGTAFLHLVHPGECCARGVAAAMRIARVLVHVVTRVESLAVDTHHY